MYLVLVLGLCFFTLVSSQKPCLDLRDRDQGIYPDPDDCHKYVLCVGKRIEITDRCPDDKVFDGKQCVDESSFPPDKNPCQKNQRWSIFRRRQSPRPPIPVELIRWRFNKPRCPPGSKSRFPHPTECARYYDCGADPKEDWWGSHIRECAYPLLFHSKRQRCAHYDEVDCGRRRVPLDPCHYIANQCRSVMCTKCEQRFASCANKRNGFFPWSGRKGTPYFAICRDQRVVMHGRCMSPNPGFVFIFHPVLHACLVPKGGYKYPGPLF